MSKLAHFWIKILNDLRSIIGLFFLLVGLILFLSSLVNPTDLVPEIGVRGNLWMGIIISLFGLLMLYLGYRSGDKEGGEL